MYEAHSNNVDIMAYIEQFVLPNLIAKPICAVTQGIVQSSISVLTALKCDA